MGKLSLGSYPALQGEELKTLLSGESPANPTEPSEAIEGDQPEAKEHEQAEV